MTTSTNESNIDVVNERLARRRRQLNRLARNGALTEADILEAMRGATELAAEFLAVERVGVWRVDAMGTSLECLELFERGKSSHSAGARRPQKACPAYFDALDKEKCLIVHDALADQRTAEQATSYLEPLAIGAVLDVPISVSGNLVGVMCSEHVGDRRPWHEHESTIARTIADFVARLLQFLGQLDAGSPSTSVEPRPRFRELRSFRSVEVERINLAVEREIQLWMAERGRADEEDMRRIFDMSPVPMVLTRLSDGTVRYVNRWAADMFEVSAAELVGGHMPDFHADPEERNQFMEALASSGHADGIVAELKTKSGRRLWALMTAQKLEFHGQPCVMVGFSDVTAQKLAEEAVRTSEQSVRSLFEAAPVPLLLSSLKTREIVFANRASAALFGVSPEQALGMQTDQLYVDPEERQAMISMLESSGFVDGLLIQMRRVHGEDFWAQLSARVLEYQGDACFLLGINDVTEQKTLEEKLRHLATRDSLTGAHNRRSFIMLAERELARAERTGTAVSVLSFDIDHFKRVNDAFGHAVGDEVLVALVRECDAQLRVIDVLCRLGGEEFAILLPDSDLSAAYRVAERLRARFGELEVATDDGRTVSVTASFGVARHRDDETLDRLLRRVDEALYRAKSNGRNRTERAPE